MLFKDKEEVLFASHQLNTHSMKHRFQHRTAVSLDMPKNTTLPIDRYDALMEAYETDLKRCNLILKQAICQSKQLSRPHTTCSADIPKKKSNYCQTVPDELLIQCLTEHHYYDIYHRYQYYRNQISQLRVEILEPLTERLFQNLEELSPGYEGLYQSFKAINSPFFTIHRQRLFLQNRIQLSDLKTSADKKLTLLLNQEKLFHNHRFRTALQVSSVLQSHSGSPIRLSIPETTPIIRQFKQIFHHILDKSLFIPIPTIAETTLRSQTTFFLKPDTILLTPRATVFDLMAVYIRFIEVHNERIQTNVMAFRNRYPWFSTNMLADGVTELFSDPIGLADSCRDYFNFIIAVLRGDLK